MVTMMTFSPEFECTLRSWHLQVFVWNSTGEHYIGEELKYMWKSEVIIEYPWVAIVKSPLILQLKYSPGQMNREADNNSS